MTTLSPLTAICPLDGRYAKRIDPLREYCSELGLIRFKVQAEINWLKILIEEPSLSDIKTLSAEAMLKLSAITENFNETDALRVKTLEQETNHDVKAVEYFIKEKLAQHAELTSYKELVHFALTSEDINNVAYALMIKEARDHVLFPALDKLITHLKELAHRYAPIAMLARTHGQPATPTTLGKELANFVFRLEYQRKQLASISILAKCNGAVGNFNAHAIAYPEVNWPMLAKKYIEKMGLDYHPYTTQIEPHDFIADFANTLSHCNTILIDLARDTWGYIALDYFTQQRVSTETGSSTMPHKINPIDFENAEGNLGVANALLQHFATKLPISRWQRDLSDSTVLRNLGCTLGYSLIAYEGLLTGFGKLAVNRVKIESELDNHWEILAEPIQTVMRRYGLANPYEELKKLTRGQAITAEVLQNFIQTLPLEEEIKKRLLELKPGDYLGYAEQLAKDI